MGLLATHQCKRSQKLIQEAMSWELLWLHYASVPSVCFQYSINLFFINFQIENP